MSKQRMNGKERKLAIVRAAMPLFARKGFAETTTKDLAKAARVSEPLLYKHFPSKEALYLEIQNFSCQGFDPVAEALGDLQPGAASLVRLVYYLMRALVLGQPAGSMEWDTCHRLMLKSFLEDGAYARLLYRTRLEWFCSRMEACVEAAIAAGEAQPTPITGGNRGRFAHHLGAWLALAHLPPRPAINYRSAREDLLHQAVWFVLRGMGVTDKAIAAHYRPKVLAAAIHELQPSNGKRVSSR